MTGESYTVFDLQPFGSLSKRFKGDIQVKYPQELTFEVLADSSGITKFSIGIDDIEECPPLNITCVVDVSGSMESSCAGITDGRTQYIENGFTLMDLIKHALKMVIKTLRPQDQLSIIKFNNEASVCYGPSKMTDINQMRAFKIVEELIGDNQTNIYSALIQALELNMEIMKKEANSAILFFTDGQPTISPKEGEIQRLQEYKKRNNIKCPIHTYGFGQYDRLNSQLLYEIAKTFEGMNGFIHEPTSIGTTFVNALSNILTTAVTDVEIHIDTKGIEGHIDKIQTGDFQMNIDENGFLNVSIGSIRFGQAVDILVHISKAKIITKNDLSTSFVTFNKKGKKKCQEISNFVLQDNKSDILQHVLRFETIELLLKILSIYNEDFSVCQNLLKEHIQK